MASLRETLLKELGVLGVTEQLWPDRQDGFSSLLFKGKDFAHFHNDNELDLRLTKKIIASQGLSHPPQSTYHPDRLSSSPWIELQFHTIDDVRKVVELVKLAIAAM